jgi:RES domain-containing protein
MISAWRLIHKRRAGSAFSGEGSRRYGGRWNSKGFRVVYVGDSLALSTLEVIAHAVPYRALNNFIYIQIKIPPELVYHVDTKKLPGNWQKDPPPSALKQIGDKWLQKSKTPVLKIQSIIVPVGFNYLLNPEHSDFKKITIGKPNKFFLDERLSRL